VSAKQHPGLTKRPETSGDVVSEDAVSAEVTDEQVAARAFERFLARGGEHGHDVEDWLAAEEELRGAAGISNRPVEDERREQADLPRRGTAREHAPW